MRGETSRTAAARDGTRAQRDTPHAEAASLAGRVEPSPISPKAEALPKNRTLELMLRFRAGWPCATVWLVLRAALSGPGDSTLSRLSSAVSANQDSNCLVLVLCCPIAAGRFCDVASREGEVIRAVSHGADRVGTVVDARWSPEQPVRNGIVSFAGKGRNR